MATGSTTSQRRAAVVCNPAKTDPRKLRRAVDEVAAAAGWGPSLWFETTERDVGRGPTERALQQGARLVIAAGGDGTVRAVAEGLRGSDVPLALVPAGTGNLLARNLDLPLTNLDSSLRVAFGDHERSIDLGIAEITRANTTEAEEHVFVVMAGLGLDARMIKNTSTKLKKAVGWLAYVDGITRSLPDLKPVRLRYRLDDRPPRSLLAHTVIIGNCGMLPGGMLLMPEARLDDGLLDIAALRPRGPFGWLKVWRKVAWENGVLRKSAIGRRIIDLSRDVRDVLSLRGRSLELDLESPQEFQLDGDEYGEVTEVRVRVEPHGLRIKVPPA